MIDVAVGLSGELYAFAWVGCDEEWPVACRGQGTSGDSVTDCDVFDLAGAS